MIPRCHKGSHGVNDTAESAPAVSLRLRNLYKNVQVRSRRVIDTLESELFKRLSRFFIRETALDRESGP
jgi:hypothetical protein